MEKIKEIEALTDYIRALAVHPSLPYVLSSSDDMLVKVWDWEKDWTCTKTFEGHSHYVMQVAISPSDTNTFASASLDGTIKKAAESLADPEEYPNLFEDWQVALAVESQVAGTRNTYPPAEEYLNYAERSHVHLVEAFRNMQVDEEEEHLENGDADHEVIEQNGDEESQEESQEGAVVVDADSTDVAVLVNGNEAEEEWGTNNEGTPSA